MKLIDYLQERLKVCSSLTFKNVADADEYMAKYVMLPVSDTVGLDTIRSELMASRFSEELLDYEVNNTITLLPRRLLIGDRNLYNMVLTIKQLQDNSYLASMAVISQVILDDNGNEYCTWYRVDYAD